MDNLLQQHHVWTLSVAALALYVLSAGILLAVMAANLSAAEGLVSFFKGRKPQASAGAFLLALVSNLLGSATLVLVARALRQPPSLLLLAVPLAVVLERYVNRWQAQPQNRSVHLAGLAGSASGMFGGGWAFLRGAASAAATAIPLGADPLSAGLRESGHWAVSVQLIVLYLVCLAIFFGIHAYLKHVARGSSQAAVRTALTLLLAMALVVESYVQLIGKEPQHRAAHWTGMLGSAGGMLLGLFFLMRHAPLK